MIRAHLALQVHRALLAQLVRQDLLETEVVLALRDRLGIEALLDNQVLTETLDSKEPQGILALRVQLDQLVHLDLLVNRDLWVIMVPLVKPEELDSQDQLDLLDQQVNLETKVQLDSVANRGQLVL